MAIINVQGIFLLYSYFSYIHLSFSKSIIQVLQTFCHLYLKKSFSQKLFPKLPTSYTSKWLGDDDVFFCCLHFSQKLTQGRQQFSFLIATPSVGEDSKERRGRVRVLMRRQTMTLTPKKMIIFLSTFHKSMRYPLISDKITYYHVAKRMYVKSLCCCTLL